MDSEFWRTALQVVGFGALALLCAGAAMYFAHRRRERDKLNDLDTFWW